MAALHSLAASIVFVNYEGKPVSENGEADQHTETNDVEVASTEEAAAETLENRDDIEALRADLDAAQSELAQMREEMLRARAEVDNVRKRAERDVEAAHKYGIEKLVEALLPVKDSMDLGFDAAATATEVETLREGLDLTIKMFDQAMAKIGVTALNPDGEKFDPEFHQAMMTEESGAEEGTILRVMQKGYALNDRLIRPAMVVVAKPSS